MKISLNTFIISNSGACDRLFVAESLRGMELEEHDDIILANSSRLSCLESCLGAKDFRCRSVEYDSKTYECRLSRHDRFTRKTHFRKASSASIEYFDVTCPYDQGNCFVKYLKVRKKYNLKKF